MKGILLILGLLPLLSSCAGRTVHDATPLVLPLHREKGELKLSGEFGFASGLSGSGSYALSNHFAIMGATSKNRNQFKSGELLGYTYLKMNSKYTEGGLGYFSAKETKMPYTVECFLGYGSGTLNKKRSFDNNFEADYSLLKNNFSKYFIQGNFGLKLSKHSELGIGNRLSFVRLKNFTFTENLNHHYFPPTTHLIDYDNLYIYEKVTYFAFGLDNFKITTQLGTAIGLNKSPRVKDTIQLEHSSIIATVGCHLKLRTLGRTRR